MALVQALKSVTGRVGVKSFEDLDLKDLIFFFEILLQKKDFGFDID